MLDIGAPPSHIKYNPSITAAAHSPEKLLTVRAIPYKISTI